MTFLRTLTILVALFICSAPAHAERYVGLGLGLFELDAGANKKSTFGSYLQLGHDFMPYLGAEIRLGGTASASSGAEKVRMDWFVAHFLKPYVEVSSDITLYSLIGFTVNHTSFRPSAVSKLNKTNISFSYGLGAEIAITDSIRLAGEWTRYATEADAATRATTFKGLDVNGFVSTIKYEF